MPVEEFLRRLKDLNRYYPTNSGVNRHTELCTDFLVESVTRAGHDELTSTEGIRKAEFISFLEQTE